jgi:FtsH-binding integral membrane protein
MEEKPQGARAGGGDGGAYRIAVGVENPKPHKHHMIPVWFFVGVILLIYGLIILGTGIYEFSSPPPTVLSKTHPALWWGALLTIIGGVYVYVYMPKKS